MTHEKRLLYQKAYVELYELIKFLSDEERNKIPYQFIEYIYTNMDKNYTFHIDNTKGLLEQDYMIETRALIVKLYEKYFSPESEIEFWNKYHKICFNMIEKEKSEKYNPNDIFNTQNQTEKIETIEKVADEATKNQLPISKQKSSIFQRIINKIKSFINSRLRINRSR